ADRASEAPQDGQLKNCPSMGEDNSNDHGSYSITGLAALGTGAAHTSTLGARASLVPLFNHWLCRDLRNREDAASPLSRISIPPNAAQEKRYYSFSHFCCSNLFWTSTISPSLSWLATGEFGFVSSA